MVSILYFKMTNLVSQFIRTVLMNCFFYSHVWYSFFYAVMVYVDIPLFEVRVIMNPSFLNKFYQNIEIDHIDQLTKPSCIAPSKVSCGLKKILSASRYCRRFRTSNSRITRNIHYVFCLFLPRISRLKTIDRLFMCLLINALHNPFSDTNV